VRGDLESNWLVPLVVIVEASLRIFRDRPAFHAVLWLNPLFLVEGFGQLHPDLLGALFATAGILLSRRSPGLRAPRPGPSPPSKLNFNPHRSLVLVVGDGRLCATSPEGSAARDVPRRWPPWSTPHSGEAPTPPRPAARAHVEHDGAWRLPWVDVAGTMAGALRGNRRRRTRRSRSSTRQRRRAWGWRIAQLVMAPPGPGSDCPHRPSPPASGRRRLALATGAFVIAVVTLASPKFQSWYLLAALPFFGLSCPPAGAAGGRGRWHVRHPEFSARPALIRRCLRPWA
jgi:hypothetical protein